MPEASPRNILIICGWNDDVSYDYALPLYGALNRLMSFPGIGKSKIIFIFTGDNNRNSI